MFTLPPTFPWKRYCLHLCCIIPLLAGCSSDDPVPFPGSETPTTTATQTPVVTASSTETAANETPTATATKAAVTTSPSFSETTAPQTPSSMTTPTPVSTPTLNASTTAPPMETTAAPNTPTDNPITETPLPTPIPTPTQAPTPTSEVDNDGDGMPASIDCNDNDDEVGPWLTEICDGKDNTCNGLIDDNDPAISDSAQWYADGDGDGYGTGAPTNACVQPPTTSNTPGDCDDSNSNAYPGAPETCTDTSDLNCDGNTGFEDGDGDGVAACEDCDDNNPNAYPGGQEVCDDANADEDCDGLMDNSDSSTDASTKTRYYPDADGDGFGDNTHPGVLFCDAPSSYAAAQGDCNDTDGDIHPDATEICDGLDNDCDGLTDDEDDLSDGLGDTFYIDNDGDGYGDSDDPITACARPAGTVTSPGDCDDGDASTFPGAPEACNLEDEDCDGDIDEGAPLNTYYPDGDGDGYGGAGSTVEACEAPANHAIEDGDCNDNNATINPGAQEVCDASNVDEDCDELADNSDNSASDGTKTRFYPDNDGDGLASDSAGGLLFCDAPTGYVTSQGDCDDSDDAVYPGANEICDGQDNDCDEDIDNDDSDLDASTETTFYADNDGDGYGNNADSTSACSAPAGFVATPGDCNDNEGDIAPGEAELCDDIDQDCDGDIDEGLETPPWYEDSDGDGFGDASQSVEACEAPSGYVDNGLDCNDDRASAYPDAVEICNDLDDDCDTTVDENTASTTWYSDDDGDSFGDKNSSVSTCEEPAGHVLNSDDCDDSDADINPAGTEVCADGLDNDCDGLTDDPSAVDTDTYYADNDGDDFGDIDNTTQACDSPNGFVADDSDCNDDNASTFPGAEETCDLEDEDCDGAVDEGLGDEVYFLDSDQDGYGDDDNTITVCGTCPECSEGGGDCDDADALTFPGAIERLDNKDNDCDGTIERIVSAGVALTQFEGIETTGRLGYSIDLVGDFDGDGFDDLAMGAPRMNNKSGAVFVAYGAASPAGSIPVSQGTARLNGTAVEAQIGFSVSGGDLNNDGLGDLFVGAPYADGGPLTNNGSISITYGRDNRIGTGAIEDIEDTFSDGYFGEVLLGFSLDGHGDVTGDGIDDLLVGAPWDYFTQSPTQGGYTFLLPGQLSDYGGIIGIEGNQFSHISGEKSQILGSNMTHIGDMDQDGYGDMILTGLGFIDGPFLNDEVNAGVNYLITGRDSDEWPLGTGAEQNTADLSSINYTGTSDDQLVGSSGAALGDINGDGYPDFLLGRTLGGSSEPLAFLYLGGDTMPASGFATDSAHSILVTEGSLNCPCVAGSIGDLNSDGYDDFALGVTTAGGGGEIYIFFGFNLARESFPSTIQVESVAAKVITAEATGDDLGYDITGRGDFNGDGLDDFAVSATGHDNGSSNELGKVYVYYGFE